MTSPEGQGYRKRPTNIQHAEGPDSTGPWSLTKSVKFGEPSAEPEEHNEALPATCSNTAQSPADLEQTNLSRDASPRRPGQCIWVLDDPIVRGKRFRLQCRAPKENNDLHLLFVRTEKKRLSVVALDVALAKEKGLEAAKLVYNKRLAKPFLCSRAVRLDFSYRKQDCSMAVTPASNGEAQVALCLVKESDTLGSAMWTLLDFVVVQVCQTTPLQAEDPVQKSKEEMLAEAGEKLRDDLGRLVHSLKVAAFYGAREAAQSLIHKESSADNRSMLRRISQARSVESVIECAKMLDRNAQKGFQDLKNTIRNLCSILVITWDSREKLPWSFYQIESDNNITPKIDVRARSQMTMSNLSVHDMGGVTISNFRVLLSWYGDDGRSDLDLYLSCPECEGVVHHQNKCCNCLEQLQLTLEGLEAVPESSDHQEALGVDLAAADDAGARCIRSITKDGPLDQACARDNIQLQPGDLLLGVENQTVRIQKSKPCRVEMDVDHLGPKHMRSEQNVFVQQPSDKTYVLQVHLFAGDPVEYQVLVQRVGFPDIVYNLPAHQETDETVDVFSMTALQLESAWEPLELD